MSLGPSLFQQMQYQQQPRWQDRNNSRDRKGNFAQLGELALGNYNTYNAPQTSTQAYSMRTNPQYNMPQTQHYQPQTQKSSQNTYPYPSAQPTYQTNNQYSNNYGENNVYKTQYTNNAYQKPQEYQPQTYNMTSYNTNYRANSIDRNPPPTQPWQPTPSKPSQDISAAQNQLRLLKQKMSFNHQPKQSEPVGNYRTQFVPEHEQPYQENRRNQILQSISKPNRISDGNEFADYKPMNPARKRELWDEVEQQPAYMPPKPIRGRRVKEEPLKPAAGNDDVPAIAKGKPVMPVQEYDDQFDEADLIECPEGCGRKFKDDALDKHTRVCQQVFQKKRKQFDSKGHRIIDGEHAQILKQQTKASKQPKAQNPSKKNKWKAQSEGFRAMMKASKGGEISKEEMAAIQANEDDRVQCEHCGRKFNEQAGKRHIAFCKEKNQYKRQK